MSTCPIYQKRGDQLVPVLVIDEAPSSDPSAAGHLVGSNGIASAMQELREVVESGDGYIRYASGLQMCWGFSSTVGNKDTTIAFPIGLA